MVAYLEFEKEEGKTISKGKPLVKTFILCITRVGFLSVGSGFMQHPAFQKSQTSSQTWATLNESPSPLIACHASSLFIARAAYSLSHVPILSSRFYLTSLCFFFPISFHLSLTHSLSLRHGRFFEPIDSYAER